MEGWAFYTQQMNSKELRLSFYKQAMNDTFQEGGEATAKYQRAQLSSCQLPTYFAD